MADEKKPDPNGGGSGELPASWQMLLFKLKQQTHKKDQGVVSCCFGKHYDRALNENQYHYDTFTHHTLLLSQLEDQTNAGSPEISAKR